MCITEYAEEVLHVMTDLVGDDIRLGKIPVSAYFPFH